MRTKIATIAAVTVPLILSAAGAVATERDWSASIGNGHAIDTAATATTPVGSPASAHWSASIGTGQIAGESTRRLYADVNVPTTHAGKAHWTSKIGTAHAADVPSNTQSGKVTS